MPTWKPLVVDDTVAVASSPCQSAVRGPDRLREIRPIMLASLSSLISADAVDEGVARLLAAEHRSPAQLQ